MAAPYLTSDRPNVDSQSSGIEIGFVDLLDQSGTVVASWGVHSPRCTIGSAQEASVRVQDGNLAANHVLLIFGKKFTLLKALAQPTRVSGRPVKEWLIDTSTTIELGELTFVVHPFSSRPASSVVRGERLSEIASRMGAAAPQPSEAQSVDGRSTPAIHLVEPRGGLHENEVLIPPPSSPPVEKTSTPQELAPEVFGQIKQNMESLAAAVAALQANSVQSQLDVQANTESAVLASTQKMMEGFADRWFSDIRRELSTFGSQQQESVSQLTQSLDTRLNSLEHRIETIGVSSSEEIRVLTNQISSLANDQSDLRSSLSELNKVRETPSVPRSQPVVAPPSLESVTSDSDIRLYADEPSFSRSVEFQPKRDPSNPSLESLPEPNRLDRMDGSEWGVGNSSDFSEKSPPYYASNSTEPEYPEDQDFGQSIHPAEEPDAPYQKAPHAMQWDAPVDDSSDQSYLELLRRLERNQTEVEKRSESLLAPELPPEQSNELSSRSDYQEIDWDSRTNNRFTEDAADGTSLESSNADGQNALPRSVSPGTDRPKASGAPVVGESAEELEYLRSLSAQQNLEPESVDLRQLQAGLDSDAIGSRLERLLAEASDRRKVPHATENPLDRLQIQAPQVLEEVSPPKAFVPDNRNAGSAMVQQLLRHSTELPVEAGPGGDSLDTGERELQALYASLGLVRNPSKGTGQGQAEDVIPDVAADNSHDEISGQQVYPHGGVGEDVIHSPSYEVDNESDRESDNEVERPRAFDSNQIGIGNVIEEQSASQKPSNYEDLGELHVQNGVSALGAALNQNDGTVEPSDEQNSEEESIEEYMQRLLQRVRSGPNSSPVSAPVNSRKSSLPSIPKRVTELPNRSDEEPVSSLSPAISEASPASTPLSRPFSSLPPRGANRAPEAKAELDALRELANSNARRAIKRSDKRRNSTDLLVNVAVCAFSLACGLALLVMNGFQINVTFLGMTSAFIVSILWGVDSVRTYLTILREQKDVTTNGVDADE